MSASPVCIVNGASTANGTDVGTGAIVTVALASTAGVNTWSLQCIGTDENTLAANINASIVINSITKTATFTAPIALGTAVILRSTVNGGVSNGINNPSLSTTMGVYTLSTAGLRVMAFNERLESNAKFGWISTINAAIRIVSGGGGGTAPTVTAVSPAFAWRIVSGFPITITGSAFTTATTAKINGATCGSFVVVNDTTITCTTPTLSASGVYDVSVTNPTGTGTLAGSYTAVGSLAWFRADLGVAITSGQITDWADQSGHGKDTTSTSGTRPTLTSSWHNSRPAVHSDGTTFMEGATNILASPGGTYTVFFVGESAPLTADPSGGTVYTERKTSPYASHQHFRFLVQYIYGDGVDAGANISLHPNHFYTEVSAPFRCTSLMNGTGNAPVILINGVSCNIDSGHQTTPTGDPGFFLFKNSVGQFWNGYFAEMIIVPGVADAPTIAQFDSYVSARYAL